MSVLLAGCSFSDPMWQTEVPWSIEYSKTHPSYIVAKAGMGIRGICTEVLYNLKQLSNIDKVILVLPTLWRMDIEIDEDSQFSNAMVDRLWTTDGKYTIDLPAKRKWIVSGGLNYDGKTDHGKLFKQLYKQQGFLVILKEHLRALRMLLDYCKNAKIPYYITTIQDPVDQLQGLEYVTDQILDLLTEVEYGSWFRFDGKFIDKFLNHSQHPSTEEHQLLCKYILKLTNQEI